MTGRLALLAILAGLLALVMAEPPKTGIILPVDDLENPPPAQPKVSFWAFDVDDAVPVKALNDKENLS